MPSVSPCPTNSPMAIWPIPGKPVSHGENPPIFPVLLTHATIGRPPHGDYEYVLWAIGTGHLANPPMR